MGKTTCVLHGRVLARCRCADPKHDKTVQCPGPPRCEGVIFLSDEQPYDWAKEDEWPSS